MNPQEQSSHKNQDIEVLRAFAIIYTLIVHLRVLLPPGNALLTPLAHIDLSVGVDLFLVISGFVITGSLLESSRDGRVARRTLMYSFWIKRIFRLLPAAWTWLAIACIAQLLIIRATTIPYHLDDVLVSAAAALGNVMNLYTPYCIANGGGPSCLTGNFVGHYWSLSLEEQFYLVFPFLFFFLRQRTLVVLLITAILVQLMWQRPFFSYAWYFKTDALCWGILLALFARTDFYHRHLPLLLRYRYIGAISGLALLALLPIMGSQVQGIGTEMKPYGVALVALCCAAIVWLASYDKNVFSIGGHYRSIMLYLGSRSYSLYLSHLVVYLSTQALFSQFGNGLTASVGAAGVAALLIVAAGSLTLLGAELTYRGVETALRPRGREIAARLMERGQAR